jgi:hypothetical protein
MWSPDSRDDITKAPQPDIAFVRKARSAHIYAVGFGAAGRLEAFDYVDA